MVAEGGDEQIHFRDARDGAFADKADFGSEFAPIAGRDRNHRSVSPPGSSGGRVSRGGAHCLRNSRS